MLWEPPNLFGMFCSPGALRGLWRVRRGVNAKAHLLSIAFFVSLPAGKNLYTNEYVAIKLVSPSVLRVVIVQATWEGDCLPFC